MGCINAFNEAVKGKKSSTQHPYNESIKKLVQLLEQLDRWIDEIPPTDQPQRFGNKSFRIWFQRLSDVLYFVGISSVFQYLLTFFIIPSGVWKFISRNPPT